MLQALLLLPAMLFPRLFPIRTVRFRSEPGTVAGKSSSPSPIPRVGRSARIRGFLAAFGLAVLGLRTQAQPGAMDPGFKIDGLRSAWTLGTCRMGE